MTRLHADCRSGRFNGVIWLVSRSDKSTKLFRAENAVWYIENPINPEHLSTPWNRSNGPRRCTWRPRSRPKGRRKVYGLVNKGTVKPICLYGSSLFSTNERLRMHQVRRGCVCMRRGSFWVRSVILVQTITDKARLIYPSGCGKFRDDSYEEACKSRDILGNGWIPPNSLNHILRKLSYRSTLRWSFDHRLRVFASTPITVLKRVFRPKAVINNSDRLLFADWVIPFRSDGLIILHPDAHDDFTLLMFYRREDEIASTCGDAVAGSRARGMKHRVASWDRASSACLVFCRAVPCCAVHARLFHAR
ncbi:hypothetical protein ALC62_00269 [Cyphomyrmex costatus]|uniref:Uncharacterized protein n=1 Tax=Cyphomyrmex costatus TaxID=456900 RepID=A0A195D7H4_9HYME|nr:hypothetical protein ALC62_00269 [Cyphomyrmex costatus]